MKGRAARDVDEYLRGLSPKPRAALSRLRRTIQAAAPEAVEAISYRMPSYRLHGPLVYFAAFTDHCSLFPASKRILRQFDRELARFDASGATIRFTPEKPLPAALVRRIVKARVRENETKQALRTARRRK
jgi:uncharacterized protein YdhG (YjbR/CyaY superfamily)